MLEISLSEFKNFKDKHEWIFMFTLGFCTPCKQYFNEIKDEELLGKYVKVKAETEEELLDIDINALPCTTIFDRDGGIKWRKYGILFGSQLEDLKKNFTKYDF